jgi:predicted DNA-binding transcriptional regulator AlpA
MKNKDLADADAVAAACGVSRRTVIRTASRNGGIVPLGNKFFVKRSSVSEILDGRTIPSVEKATAGAITLQQAAVMLGCSRSTVLRVVERTGLGVQIGGRRYVLKKNLNAISMNIAKPGLPIRFQDPEEMRRHASRMARKLWRVRKSPKAV